MINKKIILSLILILLVSCLNPTNLSEKNIDKELSILQPTVDITSPDDGAEITDQYIIVEGFAYDEMGLNYYQWMWEWSDGSQSGDQEIDPPIEYYEFQIDIGPLIIGENTVTVTFFNTEGGSGSDSVTFYYVSDDNYPPEVVITYPPDGEVFTEPDITVLGYADDHGGSGIVKLFWTHTWVDGSDDDAEYYDIPQDTITFEIPITLRPGENTIKVNAMDADGNSLEFPPKRTVNLEDEEEGGVRIDAIFQPVQTVYPHDPVYGDDIYARSPCVPGLNNLKMVAGKNTFLFGYPYNSRNQIKMIIHNNNSEKLDFHWVLKIEAKSNPEEEIWRSNLETVGPGEKKTFTYSAPLPSSPFQWNRWSGIDSYEWGYIILEIDPDVTGGNADCNCVRIYFSLDVAKTHDLNVLFLPFTFGDGPEIPNEIASTSYTQWDTWRHQDLEPWWNAIFPVREKGVDTSWKTPLKQNIKLMLPDNKSKLIHNLSTFNALNDNERKIIYFHMFKLGISPGLIGKYDRVVILVHPDILKNSSGAQANGMAVRSTPGNAYKNAVIVNWSTKTKTCVHEVGHTYDLNESYLPGQRFKAVGYWVNKKYDVLNSNNNRDLMWATYPIWGSTQKSWIKKPNFKNLTTRFSEEEDPSILSISGMIDINENIELFHWYQLEEGFIDIPWNSTGKYLINAYSNSGSLIAQTGFNISYDLFTENAGIWSTDNMIFSFRVELLSGISRIDIVKKDTKIVLASRSKSANSPQISIINPSPGEKIKQEVYEVKWDGYDLDQDDLIYNVFIKNTSEDNWYPVVSACENSSYLADLSFLVKDDYELKLVASDGWNTVEDMVDFQVKNIKNSFIMLLRIFEDYPLIYQLLQRVLLI
jgi:hypothetical protein